MEVVVVEEEEEEGVEGMEEGGRLYFAIKGVAAQVQDLILLPASGDLKPGGGANAWRARHEGWRPSYWRF